MGIAGVTKREGRKKVKERYERLRYMIWATDCQAQLPNIVAQLNPLSAKRMVTSGKMAFQGRTWHMSVGVFP